MQIVKNGLTENIFIDLRKEGPFVEYSYQDVKKALQHTLFSIVIFEKNIPIAMGRIVGDGRISFFIKDVVVKKEYRSLGIGKIVMKELIGYIKTVGCYKAYVGLMSSLGHESFYEQFGFIRRPNKDFGAGMILFLEDKDE